MFYSLGFLPFFPSLNLCSFSNPNNDPPFKPEMILSFIKWQFKQNLFQALKPNRNPKPNLKTWLVDRKVVSDPTKAGELGKLPT